MTHLANNSLMSEENMKKSTIVLFFVYLVTNATAHVPKMLSSSG